MFQVVFTLLIRRDAAKIFWLLASMESVKRDRIRRTAHDCLVANDSGPFHPFFCTEFGELRLRPTERVPFRQAGTAESAEGFKTAYDLQRADAGFLFKLSLDGRPCAGCFFPFFLEN